jgi:TRAP-type C4-dicarboxylate transport system permease small subunit
MMMKKLLKSKNIISVLMMFFLFGLFILSSQAVFAQNYGLTETKGTATNLPSSSLTASGPTGTTMATRVGQIIGIALSFVGALFLLLIIYGGILWMTARGNEQQVTKAKDLIISAVIGLIIVLSAYAITTFVGGQLAK